jgi:hypothetical protein
MTLVPVRRNGQVFRGESGGSGLPFDAQPLWSPSNLGRFSFRPVLLRRNDIRNDDTKHKGLKCDTT